MRELSLMCCNPCRWIIHVAYLELSDSRRETNMKSCYHAKTRLNLKFHIRIVLLWLWCRMPSSGKCCRKVWSGMCYHNDCTFRKMFELIIIERIAITPLASCDSFKSNFTINARNHILKISSLWLISILRAIKFKAIKPSYFHVIKLNAHSPPYFFACDYHISLIS